MARLQIDNPRILERNILVGGAACLFYRDQLEGINDRDFLPRTYSDEEEKTWLSRDADFATTEPEEMPDRAGDIPLGRLQMGFVLGAEEFRENARRVELRWANTVLTLLIADPLDLWREKEAATHRRARPQDGLHLEILGLTLQWEMVHYAGLVATSELPFVRWKARMEEVKRRWNSILQNPRLRARLQDLNVPEITEYSRSSP
ncbi:MAG TPA: hypothetical protein VHY09_15905 [Candidatus Methylacidiphilales bacterium]|nr:hypothetical protein [Candidatus Methylacidiphilales bacterium]